jgi:hypothetical protein
MLRPIAPPTRLIREGETLMCRTCGSGRYAHRPGAERSTHRFNPASPAPFVERYGVTMFVWALLVVGFVLGYYAGNGGGF